MEVFALLWILFMAYITYVMVEIRGGPIGWAIVVLGWILLAALLILLMMI